VRQAVGRQEWSKTARADQQPTRENNLNRPRNDDLSRDWTGAVVCLCHARRRGDELSEGQASRLRPPRKVACVKAGRPHRLGVMRGALVASAGLVFAGRGVYRLVARGQLTLDTGIGRRLRRLGPADFAVAAPRELVFDMIATPYLGRTPRALQDELAVWERGSDMVLAAHFTEVTCGTTTTVETVGSSGRSGSTFASSAARFRT
jgi:hypothetical protein